MSFTYYWTIGCGQLIYRGPDSDPIPNVLPYRLERDVIILHGSRDESAGSRILGSVVLRLEQPLKVEEICLVLTGTQQVS